MRGIGSRSAGSGGAPGVARALLAALALALAFTPAAAGAGRQVRIDSDAYMLRAKGPALFDVFQEAEATVCSAGSMLTPVYTPVGDGQLFSGGWFEDGFDYGLTVVIAGDDYSAPGNRVRAEGDTVRAGARNLGGLRVSRVDAALRSGPVLRSLVRLRNPSGAPVSRTVTVASDLGTDGQTAGDQAETIHATSSGDQAFTAADRWLVSGQAQATPYGDPFLTHVLAGKGAATPIAAVQQAPGPLSGCVEVTYDVTVPARATRYLLLFAELNPTAARGATRAGRYERRRLSRAELAGLARKVRPRVVNWNLG